MIIGNDEGEGGVRVAARGRAVCWDPGGQPSREHACPKGSARDVSRLYGSMGKLCFSHAPYLTKSFPKELLRL